MSLLTITPTCSTIWPARSCSICGAIYRPRMRKVLRLHQRDLARFVHAQMQDHYSEDPVEYDGEVSKGFTEIKDSAFTASGTEPVLDFHVAPADKSSMARYVFGRFSRCLCRRAKFQFDPDRRLSVILDRDSLRWFGPARGQFQIFSGVRITASTSPISWRKRKIRSIC